MRRGFIHGMAILAFAIGAGLFAFGRQLDPPIDPANPTLAAHRQHFDPEIHPFAAMACGVGVSLMALGGLTLAMPHVNAALHRWESTGTQRI